MHDDRCAGFDRGVLLALFASGVLWIAGFSLGLRTGLYFGGFGALFVVLASLALASRSLPTGRTFAASWVGAVLLLAGVLAPVGWGSLAIGVVLGSALFLAWSLTGWLLLGAFTGRTPGPGPPPDRRA